MEWARCKLALFGAVGLSFASPSEAAVMTFEGVVSASTYQVPITPYSEAGFTLTNLQGSASQTDGIFGPTYDAAHTVDGSAVFFWCANCFGVDQSIIRLSAAGDAPFSLASLDAGFLENDRPSNQSIIAVGNLAGGGTVTQTLDLGVQWATYTLSGFDSVVSVDFRPEFGGRGDIPNPAFDNLVLSAVPEPSTWAMIILGFVGIAIRCLRPSPGRRVTSVTA